MPNYYGHPDIRYPDQPTSRLDRYFWQPLGSIEDDEFYFSCKDKKAYFLIGLNVNIIINYIRLGLITCS
jgi:hypothetical protein